MRMAGANKMRSVWFLVGMVVAGIVAGCAPVELVDASGEEIYTQLCARCHGIEMEGGAAPAFVITAETSDEYLVTTIRDGFGAMAGFGETLTDAQIRRVVDFLRASAGSEG